ncbi:hypothetical protein GLOIN_2v1804648 [Rhizophagus clarus]|uniref:Uncharacterized protein n=1 Tax=Rhizophagus clarus TaxID=94130 RepID=A0A8H3LJ60_9GLOM|nr:hypothetical protein GLOIN_2v1804648 [Rhizophagus clarus]
MVLRKKKKVRYIESSSSDSDDYVEGSKYKNAGSNRYARKEDNSRESTPCPTTSTTANTLIITPNKPIVTRATFNQYSVHVICSFNTTIQFTIFTKSNLHSIFDCMTGLVCTIWTPCLTIFDIIKRCSPLMTACTSPLHWSESINIIHVPFLL